MKNAGTLMAYNVKNNPIFIDIHCTTPSQRPGPHLSVPDAEESPLVASNRTSLIPQYTGYTAGFWLHREQSYSTAIRQSTTSAVKPHQSKQRLKLF